MTDSPFVETREHRRFTEFCDACQRYRYIGLCYGRPGVGKTLSARQYAHWDKIESCTANWGTIGPFTLETGGSDDTFSEIARSRVVFYTASVVSSPGQIDKEIRGLRNKLHQLALEKIRRVADPRIARAMKREKLAREKFFIGAEWDCEKYTPPKPTVTEVIDKYDRMTSQVQDPTKLVLIDEADRFRMAGLEQIRAIFDKGDIGLVLIGMPGIEKRLARYPQLYSRVGFVHEFHALSAAEVRQMLNDHCWRPPGVTLPENALAEEETIASILRVTGGNFRLLSRLLTQVGRILEINRLSAVSGQVIEAARESLVIGTA